MEKNKFFKKDMSIRFMSERTISRFLAVFFGALFTLATTSVFATVEKGGGDPVKRKSSMQVHTNSYGGRSANLGYFPSEDLPKLGKKGFIYPYKGNEKILETHGDFVYTDYKFEDYALENNDKPADNTQFPEGALAKNLLVERELGDDGVTSWTITFYPHGRIFNKPTDLSRNHSLDNAMAGVAITKDIEIIDSKIEVEVLDGNGEKIGGKDILPGGRNGLNEQISGMKSAEYTISADRTKVLFFGDYNGKKDPLNLRAGGLKSVSEGNYKELFDKSFVFESRTRDTDTYVIRFKTKEIYQKRITLNAYSDSSADIRQNRDKYISGVMAGIGSYQQGRTVAGVNFYGKKVGDKIIFTEILNVKETFLSNDNTIIVPERKITFNKKISSITGTDEELVDYSVAIDETLKMPSGSKLSGDLKEVETKYIMVDYEKYTDDPTSLHSDYTHVLHKDYSEIRRLSESMTPIPGYNTEISEVGERYDTSDRNLGINIVHTSNNYSSPEKRLNLDLNRLTEKLKSFINDYPMGVGNVAIDKSDADNLDDVPTPEDLERLKEQQDEIEQEIERIRQRVEGMADLAEEKKREYKKVIDAYEKVYNGFNKESINEFKPKYDEVKELSDGGITADGGEESYNKIIKGLNDVVMGKLREKTDITNIQSELLKGVKVKAQPRYRDASSEKKKAFDKAFSNLREIYSKGRDNTGLAEFLKAQRDLNKAIIELTKPEAPTLTAPVEDANSVSSTVPQDSKAGDVIKLFVRDNGIDKEIGSYTLKEEDLTKSSIELSLNKGVTLVEGERLLAKSFRDSQPSESSEIVLVKGVLKCTADPATGDALDTLVGVSTLNRGNGVWDLKGLGAYIALESNTKGFVITRNANPASNITNPIEGMLVWDTTAKCLKLYSNKTGSFQWNCIKQGCNNQ